jgi:hypothetical protein
MDDEPLQLPKQMPGRAGTAAAGISVSGPAINGAGIGMHGVGAGFGSSGVAGVAGVEGASLEGASLEEAGDSGAVNGGAGIGQARVVRASVGGAGISMHRVGGIVGSGVASVEGAGDGGAGIGGASIGQAGVKGASVGGAGISVHSVTGGIVGSGVASAEGAGNGGAGIGGASIGEVGVNGAGVQGDGVAGAGVEEAGIERACISKAGVSAFVGQVDDGGAGVGQAGICPARAGIGGVVIAEFMADQVAKAQLKKWEEWVLPLGLLDSHLSTELLTMTEAQLQKLCWIQGTSLEDELYQLSPNADDFLPNSSVPRYERYLAASKQIFRPGRTYINQYQAKQHAFRFLSLWGIHMTSIGTTFVCHYRARPEKKNESVISPSRRRKTNTSSGTSACPFKVPFTPLYSSTEKSGFGRAFIPVRMTKGIVLEHTCNPCPQTQADARQRSGYYTKSVPPSFISPLLAMKPGMLPARVLREYIQQVLPVGVPITSTQVNNFRLRLVGMSLTKDRSLQAEKSKALAECKGLDTNELELLNHDISLLDAREILRSQLNDSDSYWRVEQFLQGLKTNDDFFAYEIMRDNSGCPIGVVWTTKTQREYFVRFGETLSLDAKKKKLNKLSWDLLSAVVVDENHSPRSACEGLFVQEDISGYAFLLRFLLRVETRRSASTIHAIWSDGILQPSFLSEAGLCSETTVLLLDVWHLINKVWPEYFGAHFFKSTLQGPMTRMCNAHSEESFQLAYREVQELLSNDPQKGEYVAGYAAERHRFASYCLRKIPGTLGRHGSTASEQTHSSIGAHLGDYVLAPEEQIEALLTRQRNVLATKLHSDRQYSYKARVEAARLPANHPNKHAIVTLARRPFEKYWMDLVSLDVTNYTATETDTAFLVQRRGQSLDSARVLLKNERCDCNDRVQYLIQCKHEYCIDKAFVAEKFDFRHFQSASLPPNYWKFVNGKLPVGSEMGEYQDGDGFPVSDDFDADSSCSTEEGVSAAVTCPPVESAASREHTSQQKVEFREANRATTELANLISRSKPEKGQLIYGAVLSLIEVARKYNSSSEIHSAIVQAVGGFVPSYDDSSVTANPPIVGASAAKLPIPGEAINPGRHQTRRLQAYVTTVMTGATPGPRSGSKKVKQCGFCSVTGHTISGCHKLRGFGGRQIEAREKANIANRLNSSSFAQLLPPGTVTSDKPLLDSIPTKSRFLVLHKQCFIDSTNLTQSEIDSPANIGIVVTCLDEFGDVLTSVSGKDVPFKERLIRANAVVEWINRRGVKGSKLKVISHLGE